MECADGFEISFRSNDSIMTPRVGYSQVWPEFYTAVTASLGGFAFGSVVSYSSPALPSIQADPKFEGLSDEDVSWIASLAPLAALIATPFVGGSLQWMGRKTIMFGLSVPLLLGWLLISFANGIGMVYGGRFLTGFSIGGFSLVSPLFINETASEGVRGRLASIQILALHLGILFPFLFGSFLSYEWLALSLCSVPILMGIMLLFAPESPRYLLSKGESEKATEALTWLRRGKTQNDIQNEIRVMEKHVKVARDDRMSWRGMLSEPGILKPAGICLCLMFFQFVSGIDAILFYNYQIFVDSGSSVSPNLASILVGSVQVISILIAGSLMDRIGRRILLLLSEAIVALSLGLLGLSFYWIENDPEMSSRVGWLPLFSLILFAAGYSIGIGPIPWIYLEILPSSVIGLMSGLAAAANWSTVFLATKFFPSVSNSVGADWCFWTFSILSAFGFLYALFFVQETKGKTLEELQDGFRKKKNTESP